MGAPKSAIGTLLKRGNGDGPPETFTSIAKVDNISGPNLAADPIDITALDTATGYDESVIGLKHGGDVTFDLKFMPDDIGHQNMLADFDGKVLRDWQVYFPSVTPITWSFSAYVIKYVPKAALKDALTAAVTLRISGQPTLVE